VHTERRAIASLRPDDRNARVHDEQNLEAIRFSLSHFGQVKPIVINEQDVVLCGNGTVQAARELGWTELVTVVFTGSEQEQRALAIADNRTAELALWGKDLLSETLIDLSRDFELSDLGFTEQDLEAIFPDLPPLEELEPFVPDRPKLQEPAQEPRTAHQYALLFDGAEQERRFHQWLKSLERAYPDCASAAARIDAHILAEP
jgi:ParB-like chromosome segregation protein Spo0J